MYTPIIDPKRLMHNLNMFSKIGRGDWKGINRSFGDDSELKAREYIISYWKDKLALDVAVDAAGNIWGARGKVTEPPIVFGSHHDAVKNGGAYDGALGVWLATEVMETVIENDIKLSKPFVIVSFTGEEPNAYGVSTLGSKILSGRVTQNELYQFHSDKESLADALARAGGNIDVCSEAQLKKDCFYAFVECHIEQGKRLASMNKALAAVSEITGIYREKIKVKGTANHAGTTIMSDRHDALCAASELIVFFEKIMSQNNSALLAGTIGQLNILPNSVNIIPEEAEFIAEIRTPDRTVLQEKLYALSNKADEISQRRGVEIIRETILDQPASKMNESVCDVIYKGIEQIGESPVKLISMAGHDAANIAMVCPSAMLFVRSPNGKSHCSDEEIYESDAEKAGNALINILIKLDKEATDNEQ